MPSVPSTIDLSDSSEGSLTLGIRKTGVSSASSYSGVPVITPTSPNKFFQRMSPRRFNPRKTANNGSVISGASNQHRKSNSSSNSARPLGITPSPFLRDGLVSNPLPDDEAIDVDLEADSTTSHSSGEGDEGTPFVHDNFDSMPAVTPIALDSSESSNTLEDSKSKKSKDKSSPKKPTEITLLPSSPHRNGEITVNRKGDFELHPRIRSPLLTNKQAVIAPPNKLKSAPLSPPKTKRTLKGGGRSSPLASLDSLQDSSRPTFDDFLQTAEEHWAATTSTGTGTSTTAAETTTATTTKPNVPTPEEPQPDTRTRKVRIKESKVLWSKAKQKLAAGSSSSRGSSAPKTTTAIATASTSTTVPNIKIFLLLLQPQAKIFELIQLLFPASSTTIGDILKLIPSNATEKALGSQTYIGICRPKRKAPEFTDLEQLAYADADIQHNETLVAIPEGFTARHVVSLSKQILANPRIQQLLQKSNTSNTTKNRRKKSSRSDLDKKRKKAYRNINSSTNGSSTNSSSTTTTTPPILAPPRQKLPMVHEERPSTANKLASPSIEEKMRRARETAAISNASSLETFLQRKNPRSGSYEDKDLDDNSSFGNSFTSLTSHRSQRSYSSQRSHNQAVFGGNYEEDSSLQGSYTSWSKSLDTSLMARRSSSGSSSVAGTRGTFKAAPTTVPLSPGSKRRRARNARTIRRCAAASFVYMALRYLWDVGTGTAPLSQAVTARVVWQEPLGWTGFFAFVVCFAALCKWQKQVRRACRKRREQQQQPPWQLRTPPRTFASS